MEHKKLKGKVDWFNEKKGFGLIIRDGEEFFVHHSGIESKIKGFKILKKDEEVMFSVGKDNKGKVCALNVTALEGKKLYFESRNERENKNNKKQVQSKKQKNKRRRPKNTETFKPEHSPPDMRIMVCDNKKKYDLNHYTRDIVLVPGLFGDPNDLSIYNNLIDEVKKFNLNNKDVWKLWHGDTHFIADDKLNWKEKCPTFGKVIKKIQDYFGMKVNATRLNWYKNSNEWKPFHHDAAAIKPHIAKKQNFTVGISFGAQRDACFEHSKNKTRVQVPLKNGYIYCFNKTVNEEWKHGIPQVPKSAFNDKGRISIILWGKLNMDDNWETLLKREI